MNENTPGKLLTISCSREGDFYRYWLEFFKPVHKLTPSQMKVFACFLKYRNKLSKEVSNPEILDSIVMGPEITKKVKAECKMSTSHFQVTKSNLKKKGVITDNRINPRFIPPSGNCSQIKLCVYFKFDEKEDK